MYKLYANNEKLTNFLVATKAQLFKQGYKTLSLLVCKSHTKALLLHDYEAVYNSELSNTQKTTYVAKSYTMQDH